MSRLRLLLVDVEGALLTPELRLTARAVRAARQLRGAGIELALTSGRPPRALRTLVEVLGITPPLAAFDGGVLVRSDGSLLEHHLLDDSVARAVIATMERHGLDVWVYQGDDWLVRRTDAHVAREHACVQFPPVIVGGWDVVAAAVKVVAVGDAEALARCEVDLADLYAHAAVARREPCFLEVMHPRANKGEVVRALSRCLGIPAEAIATLGGGPGDVLMFRECGLAIAMGHACAAVQRQAHFITRSSSDEGFAHAVETWVLVVGEVGRATR